MNRLKELLDIDRSHLEERDMSYWPHLKCALRHAAWAALMSYVCLIHAFIPFIFTSTFSRGIIEYNKEFKK